MGGLVAEVPEAVRPEQFRIVGSAPQAEEAERYDRVLAALSGRIDVEQALARGRALTTAETSTIVAAVVAAAAG